MASGSGSFLKVVLKNFDVLAGPLITLVYPLYASVRAIETKSPVDDQQWLTYWVLYSMITLFELTFGKFLECGAAFVYEQYVRPLFINHQTVNIWYMPGKKDNINKPDDVLQAADKYIAENGPEALERLISKTEKVSKSRNSGRSSRTILDDVRAERESKTGSGYYNDIFDEDYRY